jgi:hypothetical protein
MRLIYFVLLALSTVAGCLGADTQPPWKGVVEVSGSTAVERTEAVRSLASLVYTFCVTYHVPVTYEDAPLEASTDVVDVTANSASPRHVYIPRGGPLQFGFSVNPQDGRPVDVASAISAAIAAHQTSGYPGEYTAIESGGMLHVIPVATLDKEGRRTQTAPLMSETLTLPSGEDAKVGPVIRAVLKSAGAARNRKIVLGSFLPQQFEEIALPLEPNPLSARDWISKALAAGGIKMSWLLLYDPRFDYYVVTLYPIQQL